MDLTTDENGEFDNKFFRGHCIRVTEIASP